MERLYLDTVERLADAVRSRRQELGWTQAALADKAGVGRRFVVDTEAGHARAELGKTLQVLRALGVEPYAVPVAPDHVRRAAASRG